MTYFKLEIAIKDCNEWNKEYDLKDDKKFVAIKIGYTFDIVKLCNLKQGELKNIVYQD